MAGRSNRRRAKVEKVDPAEISPSAVSSSSGCSSSYSDRVSERKIPLPDRGQQQLFKNKGEEEEEKPSPQSVSRDPRALRKLLLSILRSYYIEAMSRLPADVLMTARARGLLVGGHCYGPLRPVENIIINSVWYAAAFPFRRSDAIDAAVVGEADISRLVHRSLDGLVASLRHCCPALSHDDALWHLGLSGGDLHGAASSVRGAAAFNRTELETVQFQVAAQEAGHPKPAAFALFLTSVLPAVKRDAVSLLAMKRRLCLLDILHLSTMLVPLPLPDELPPQPSPQENNQKVIRIIYERKKCFQIGYQMWLDIANAALRKFARQTGKHYHLHTIYGQSIVNNEDNQLERYVHINFMALRKVGLSLSVCQSEDPVHFFVEANNPPPRDCPEEDITLCCMVSQLSPCHADNCYACMVDHTKIDHPDTEMHFGGHPHKIVTTERVSDCPSTVDADYRFFDPDRDIGLVQFYADKVARMDAIISKYRSENAPVRQDDTSSEEDDTDDEDTSDEDISGYCTAYL